MAETYTIDSNLFAGDFKVVTGGVTVKSGETLERGAILGALTADGKYVQNDTTANDGSEAPVCILAEDCDASSGDVTRVPVYLSGQFDAANVTYGGTDTKADVYDALVAKNIYLVDVTDNSNYAI